MHLRSIAELEQPDSSYAIAHHLAALKFEDLPDTAVEAARLNLLDTVGVALAGADAPGCREVTRMVLDNYGSSQAHVWGTGRMATAAEAALANGVMAHALDFDDTHDGAVLHAGVSAVPAALAVADRLGGVSGRELIKAVAAGLDLTCRLGIASSVPPLGIGWMYTALYGVFGATATAGILLRLDAERMSHAFGIAYARAAGNTQCVPDGALTKRMQPGFSAQVGVLSAMMAAAGVTATTNTFDGKYGLGQVYLRGHLDREILLQNLGIHFEHVNLSYKPYPSCRHTHTSIDVALRLAMEEDVDVRQIESISVLVTEDGHRNVCAPRENKIRPRSVVDAQFSIPFCVATALTRRDVFVGHFTQTALVDQDILRLASLVRTDVDPQMNEEFGRAVTPAAVKVVMKSGAVYAGRSDQPRGGSGNPMDFDALANKFRRCTQYAGEVLPGARTESLIAMFRALEDLRDVRQLTSQLA
jgi:2-methylcitrate dehydratase PrpD